MGQPASDNYSKTSEEGTTETAATPIADVAETVTPADTDAAVPADAPVPEAETPVE